MPKVKDIKDGLRQKKVVAQVDWGKGLSTGSTLLNLACSGQPYVGFLPGSFYHVVGDSASGKTFLVLTCMAEAGINKHYKDYRLIFDNAENGALMDMNRFFGPHVAKNLEPPAGNRNNPIYSSTVEEFYYHIDDAVKEGRPFIYVLDSMDALTSSEEEGKFDEKKAAHLKGKETTGSYNTSKPKVNSAYLRRTNNKLREMGSILIVIAQTRDNIGFGSQYTPKTRSGGHAQTFYASLELWSKQRGHIKTSYKGKDREQGIYCEVRVKKNRLSGRDRTIVIPIYHSYGIDDIGSCVDYLVEEKFWKMTDKIIKAKDFYLFELGREEIIQAIMKEDGGRGVREAVADAWAEIEKNIEVDRLPRYGQAVAKENDK